MMKNQKSEIRSQKSEVREPASVYITAERSEIEKFHAAGIREIAIRDGREYVFKQSDINLASFAPLREDIAKEEGERDAEDR